MARKKLKEIEFVPTHHEFGGGGELVVLSLSELEAMRLMDDADNSQGEAAKAMKVSRATIQRLLKTGRKKLISSVMYNKKIILKADTKIEGGNMKIAFINVEGMIGGHLGHAESITLYDLETKNFSNHTPVVTGGRARTKWLYDSGATGIIVSASGSNVLLYLASFGIAVFDGSGLSIEEALDKYLLNKLDVLTVAEKSQHSNNKHHEGGCCGGDKNAEHDHSHSEEGCCGDHKDGKHDHSQHGEGCCK